MGQIAGQVAIVTGAASEVAQGIARRFAREGAIVVLIDKDASEATRVANAIALSGGRAEAMCVDLARDGAAAEIAQAVAHAHGGIDILVNAAHAALAWMPLADKKEADFAAAFHDVVMPTVAAMRAARPHMLRRGGGRIVNVGSIYGATANEGITDAITMDGALASLTRSAGIEWARDNILVNYLQPAVPDIAVFKSYIAERGAIVDHLIRNTPMRRLADPLEDIGGAAMFLVSDEACFIVGHKVFADGGQHLVAAAFEPGSGALTAGELRSIAADRPGALVQLAYVVGDIDTAVSRWLAHTNAGPFFRARFDLTGQSYRGNPVASAIEVALAYRDEILIELIAPLDDAPSIYNEVMHKRGPGVHHVMLSTPDMAADAARHQAAGSPIVSAGDVPGFGRAIFVDTFSELGHFIEYGAWTRPVLAAIAGFRDAHRTWIGVDPVRPYPTIL